MIKQWIEELRFNFWYDLNDLLWTLVFAIGGLRLFLQILEILRG